MNDSIYPCLTIKGKIAEAAGYYVNTFGEGKIIRNAGFVIQIQLSGQRIMLLNDGPSSSPNPSISFMVTSENEDETEQYYNRLVQGGKVLMPLDSYNWSSRYAWIEDKYGVSWQLYTGSRKDAQQKFCPTLMFTETNKGKASDAVHFYTQLFSNSAINGILNYSPEDKDQSDLVKHAEFSILNFTMMAMDSSMQPGFYFNDAISFVVECDSQEEIDGYWNKLTAEGGNEVACGWLTDKYGVSWQIVPKSLANLMSDPERAGRVLKALMNMKKIIMADLENA